MLADQAFREKVCEAQRVTSWTVAITAAGAGMSVVVDQKRPAEGIPSFAKKIVGSEIHILQEETWSDSSRASLHVSIPGKPGDLKATIILAGDGAGAVETVEGDVKVSFPLIGGKLESLISNLLGAALRSEQEVGRAWLAGER